MNWRHCLNIMFEWSDHSFIFLYIVLYTFHAGFLNKIAHETHTFMCDWVSKTLLERLLVCLIWLIWCNWVFGFAGFWISMIGYLMCLDIFICGGRLPWPLWNKRRSRRLVMEVKEMRFLNLSLILCSCHLFQSVV